MNNEHVLTNIYLVFRHGLLSKHHWNSLPGCANSPSPSWSSKIFNICRVFHLSSDHPEIQKSFICEEGRKRSCYLGYPVLFLSPIFNSFHCSNNITAGLPSSRAVENISSPASKWRKIATHYNFCRISLLIIILCRKIAFSPQPNIQLTWDQSVNSSLSVVVQYKKTRALYLPWLNCGGLTKFEGSLFKILIFCRKIAISPQPSIWLTWDQSVNSSLSVVVQ